MGGGEEGEGKGSEKGGRKGTGGTSPPFRKFLDPPLTYASCQPISN